MGEASSECIIDELKEISRQTESRLETEHRLDNVYMLTYTILLTLSVLTIWLFKHRRFRFIHETGLSVIYGLIVGAIFRYGVPERIVSRKVYQIPEAVNACSIRVPPTQTILWLKINDEVNTSHYYHYSLNGESKDLGATHYRMTFNPEIFFNVILPPIIFTAGYSMKRKHFFRNFGAISLFALLGTVISALVIAMLCYGLTRVVPSLAETLLFSECVYFGSIISATDPVTVLAIFNDINVDKDLYALVFGESVLNDAVAIALSRAVEKYDSVSYGTFTGQAFLSSMGNFFGNLAASFGLGTSVGCCTALLTKYTYIRDYPLLETVLFVLLSYSTFFLSEAFGFTGIVALLFCGITQAHYTYNNLSHESRIWTKQAFELLNFLAENFVFAYIGVSTFSFRSHQWNISFILITILACFISRVVEIYPLSALINCFRRKLCSSTCCLNGSQSRELTSSKSNLCTPVSPSFKWQQWNSSSQNADSGGDFIPKSSTSMPDIVNEISGSQSQQLLESATTNSIGWNKQHVLVFCGLRGAMAFSLAIRNTSTGIRQMFFSTTIVVVMVTVFLGGCFATTLMQWLKIPVNIQPENETSNSTETPLKLEQRRKLKVTTSTNQRSCWYRFDSRFMKPLLTHSGPLLSETFPNCCTRFANLLTTTDQRHNVLMTLSNPNLENFDPITSHNSLRNILPSPSVRYSVQKEHYNSSDPILNENVPSHYESMEISLTGSPTLHLTMPNERFSSTMTSTQLHSVTNSNSPILPKKFVTDDELFPL